MTFLKAVRELEKACLSSDSPRTTAATLREVTREESRSYYQWLRNQAPVTATFLPFFDNLSRTPTRTKPFPDRD